MYLFFFFFFWEGGGSGGQITASFTCEKGIFVLRSDHNLRMCTEILDLAMQKVSLDIFNDNLAQKLSDYLFI